MNFSGPFRATMSSVRLGQVMTPVMPPPRPRLTPEQLLDATIHELEAVNASLERLESALNDESLSAMWPKIKDEIAKLQQRKASLQDAYRRGTAALRAMNLRSSIPPLSASVSERPWKPGTIPPHAPPPPSEPRQPVAVPGGTMYWDEEERRWVLFKEPELPYDPLRDVPHPPPMESPAEGRRPHGTIPSTPEDFRKLVEDKARDEEAKRRALQDLWKNAPAPHGQLPGAFNTYEDCEAAFKAVLRQQSEARSALIEAQRRGDQVGQTAAQALMDALEAQGKTLGDECHRLWVQKQSSQPAAPRLYDFRSEQGGVISPMVEPGRGFRMMTPFAQGALTPSIRFGPTQRPGGAYQPGPASPRPPIGPGPLPARSAPTPAPVIAPTITQHPSPRMGGGTQIVHESPSMGQAIQIPPIPPQTGELFNLALKGQMATDLIERENRLCREWLMPYRQTQANIAVVSADIKARGALPELNARLVIEEKRKRDLEEDLQKPHIKPGPAAAPGRIPADRVDRSWLDEYSAIRQERLNLKELGVEIPDPCGLWKTDKDLGPRKQPS